MKRNCKQMELTLKKPNKSSGKPIFQTAIENRVSYLPFFVLLIGIFLLFPGFSPKHEVGNPVEKLLSGYKFTEGPAVGRDGFIYFTDVPEWKIYRYNPLENTAELYLDNTGGANGLYFMEDGRLIGCAGRARQLIRMDYNKNIEILADSFNGRKLNSPNDLWIDKSGGIYFTDPRYGNRDNLEQDGEHVYYYSGEGKLVRVIDDLTRPNGIIGSSDGRFLYVVDEGQRKTFAYRISSKGEVGEKTLFCEEGIDGMTLTPRGNIVLTAEKSVPVYSPEGRLLIRFIMDVQPTNVVYYQDYLYVTAQSGELFRIVLEKSL